MNAHEQRIESIVGIIKKLWTEGFMKTIPAWEPYEAELRGDLENMSAAEVAQTLRWLR